MYRLLSAPDYSYDLDAYILDQFVLNSSNSEENKV
jgi:hypothetical protein